MTAYRRSWAVCSALVCLMVGTGCRSDTGPRTSQAAPSTREGAGRTPARSASPAPEGNSCATYPPPFKVTYLPAGFDKKLRKGAGLFQGTNYPTDGLLGYYRGSSRGVHVNFEVQGGPLPYKPENPQPVRVLGARGRIGTVEGGFAVEFALDGCDFRMDSYGIDRAQTEKVATGLRAKHGGSVHR